MLWRQSTAAQAPAAGPDPPRTRAACANTGVWRAQDGADEAKAQAVVPKGGPLKVCIATADFWGLKAAGGTATAYHLMAASLAKYKAFQVGALRCGRAARGAKVQELAPPWVHR